MAKLSAIAAFIISDIHSVRTVCVVVDPNNRDLIITGEVLTSIADFCVFEGECDVSDMAKRLSSRTANDGRVNLGMVHIKKLQALFWWINDLQKLGQYLNMDGSNQETMLAEMQSKRV